MLVLREVWHVTILDGEGHPAGMLVNLDDLWKGSPAENDLANAIQTAINDSNHTSSVSYDTQQETLGTSAAISKYPAALKVLGHVTLYSS